MHLLAHALMRETLILSALLCAAATLALTQPPVSAPLPQAAQPAEDTVTRADSSLFDIAGAVGASGDPTMDGGNDPLGFGLLDADPATSTPASRGNALEAMIVTALQQGQSHAFIDARINDAARRVRIDVPPQLRTPAGRVDTATLLSVLSGRTLHAGTTAAAGFYIVQPGDSLAAIAYRFYGATGFHDEIYRANHERLGTAWQLEVGQRLVMPAL